MPGCWEPAEVLPKDCCHPGGPWRRLTVRGQKAPAAGPCLAHRPRRRIFNPLPWKLRSFASICSHAVALQFPSNLPKGSVKWSLAAWWKEISPSRHLPLLFFLFQMKNLNVFMVCLKYKVSSWHIFWGCACLGIDYFHWQRCEPNAFLFPQALIIFPRTLAPFLQS